MHGSGKVLFCGHVKTLMLLQICFAIAISKTCVSTQHDLRLGPAAAKRLNKFSQQPDARFCLGRSLINWLFEMITHSVFIIQLLSVAVEVCVSIENACAIAAT